MSRTRDEGSAVPLRIEKVAARVVVMPLAEPIRHPFMGQRTQFATLLVELHCSDGCSGIGYASVESLQLTQALRSIVQGLAPALVGQDPLRSDGDSFKVRCAAARLPIKAGRIDIDRSIAIEGERVDVVMSGLLMALTFLATRLALVRLARFLAARSKTQAVAAAE